MTPLLFLLVWAITSHASSDPQCWSMFHGELDWFGSPSYDDCKKLLFGNQDLSGIAAIDERSHAFVAPNAQRQFESDSEWEDRVLLPKFWIRCQNPWPNNKLSVEGVTTNQVWYQHAVRSL